MMTTVASVPFCLLFLFHSINFKYLPDEAIGIVNAAKKFKIDVVISFTVETDGKLPDGQTLQVSVQNFYRRSW
jgi:S-methylmethionine-dependent homocysteine/selenocysteine methylase